MNREELEKLIEHIELKMIIKKVDKSNFSYEEIQLIKLCKICSELLKENNQLKENLKLEKQISNGIAKDYEILLNQKKELRSWLEDEIIDSKAGSSQHYWFGRVLSKLNEIEGDKK